MPDCPPLCRKRKVPAEAERGTRPLEAQVQDACQVGPRWTTAPALGLSPIWHRAAGDRWTGPSRLLFPLPLQEEQEAAGSPQVEAMLRELGELWEDLQRKHQENGAVLREIDKVSSITCTLGPTAGLSAPLGGSEPMVGLFFPPCCPYRR